jgi:hypothetical protein
MVTIILILLFVGALLLAIGHNTPASVCNRIGSVLLALGFGLQLFGGLAGL